MEDALFWVGIRHIYQFQIWGYESNGEALGLHPSFLTWENADESDAKCAGLKLNVLVKIPCETLLSYACEAGKHLKNKNISIIGFSNHFTSNRLVCIYHYNLDPRESDVIPNSFLQRGHLIGNSKDTGKKL